MNVIVNEAKDLSEKYNNKLQAEKEKNIAIINRKYAELRAEEALLRAKIASEAEKFILKHKIILMKLMSGMSEVKNMELRRSTSRKSKFKKTLKKLKKILRKRERKYVTKYRIF